jgi:hypothetical protein
MTISGRCWDCGRPCPPRYRRCDACSKRVKSWLKKQPTPNGDDFGHERSDHRFREAYHADDPVHYELVIEIGETKNDD